MPAPVWWIKIRIDLAQDPKTLRIAELTGLEPDCVVGKLVRVWGWAKKHSKRGRIEGDLARAAVTLLRDMVGKCHMVEAMIDVGWLCVTERDVTFPDWTEYLSQEEKKKALAAERKRKQRERDRGRRGHADVTPQIRLEENIEEGSKEPSSAKPSGKERKPRPPDPIWDELCRVFGLKPVGESECKRVGKWVATLRGKGTDPAEIAVRLARYRAEWPNAADTPDALIKHWDRFAEERNGTRAGAGRVNSAADKFAGFGETIVMQPPAPAPHAGPPLLPFQGEERGGDRPGAAGPDQGAGQG